MEGWIALLDEGGLTVNVPARVSPRQNDGRGRSGRLLVEAVVHAELESVYHWIDDEPRRCSVPLIAQTSEVVLRLGGPRASEGEFHACAHRPADMRRRARRGVGGCIHQHVCLGPCETTGHERQQPVVDYVAQATSNCCEVVQACLERRLACSRLIHLACE